MTLFDFFDKHADGLGLILITLIIIIGITLISIFGNRDE